MKDAICSFPLSEVSSGANDTWNLQA